MRRCQCLEEWGERQRSCEDFYYCEDLMPPERLELRSSSALASATYDEESETLEIVFFNGRNYTFSGVPKEVAQGLAEASSPGAYYNANIKGIYS